MASIVSGYECDIFISYRQKDNKYDGWVTDFVDHLRGELESTFKEDITTYFDLNPHDGLLESYNVDKSLEDKLKCLIFIPIISQTYCDSNSFAWQHEFCAFNKWAKEDKFGRDIRLANGNVASRILPVKIHDLDAEDKLLLETELNGVLRSIDFIYKEVGVNRPLKPNDDVKNNLNKSHYVNQINKVSNATKEIINALKGQAQLSAEVSKKNFGIRSSHNNHIITKIITYASVLLALLILGYFIAPKLIKPSVQIEKSIAVLPFENMTNDPDQEYFSESIMQEILNHLFKIGGLSIPASTSSRRFKNSKLSVREIAQQLGVSYLLEGNVTRSGDNVRIIVRLINGKNERLVWTDDYNKTMTANNLLEIQSDIAKQVADNMNIVVNPEVRKRIENKPTFNTEAYTLWLQVWNSNQSFPFEKKKSMLERAILLDPEYADAYASLAYLWIWGGGHDGEIGRDQVLKTAEPLLKKALQLDYNCVLAHSGMASVQLYYYWDFESVEKEYQINNKLNPSNSGLSGIFSDYLLASEKYHAAFVMTKNALNKNRTSGYSWAQMALVYYFDGQQEKALTTVDTARLLDPNNEVIFINNIRLLVYPEKYESAIKLFESKMAGKSPQDLIPYYLGHLGIAYFKTGNRNLSASFLNELLAKSRKSPIGSPSYFAAALYAAMGETDKSFLMLQKAYTDHEVEMYWLKVEPLFKSLHGDQRFETLIMKIGFK